MLDGTTFVATGYADLWDGLAVKPNLNENVQLFEADRIFTVSNAGTLVNDEVWSDSYID